LLIAAGILLFWFVLIVTIIAGKRDLLRSTWNEPYITETAVLIESDDWGPGDRLHAERLDGLSRMLGKHTDTYGRPAVMTADMILAVADAPAIQDDGMTGYLRKCLDQGFTDILDAIHRSFRNGTLVPQLHGIEHYYGNGIVRLARSGDIRVSQIFNTQEWTDWEGLDSPLQGHYVDGTRLPTSALSRSERDELIAEACKTFMRIFSLQSKSTVAPCYLWDDEIEQLWASHGIRYIQTAGYRCPGRDAAGNYLQDMQLIRTGQRNGHGQYYLVRNSMYEPADGRGEESCITEAHMATRQGLPVTISTHRYNYTRSEEEYRSAIDGLDTLLTKLESGSRVIRYLSSPELGAWIAAEPDPLSDPASGKIWPGLTRLTGARKISCFLYRLWYRHTKLRFLASASGLFIPFFLFILLADPESRYKRSQ
jgi:hypothetical protein